MHIQQLGYLRGGGVEQWQSMGCELGYRYVAGSIGCALCEAPRLVISNSVE